MTRDRLASSLGERTAAASTSNASGAAGKRTRTGELGAAAGVQRRQAATPSPALAPAQATAADAFSVHRHAAAGTAGSGSQLPHLAQIQQSFGRHDVSGVRAHVGGAATEASAAMGARAYACGDAVAFAHAPDLHLAAHEAAHVVQQRRGVALPGGVGQAGDVYEQHADQVADRVVRGESVEALLDEPSGGGGGAAVQHQRTRYWTTPVPGPDGTATTDTHRAELASATLPELFAAYAMTAPADPEAPVAVGAAQLTYAWITGRVGTVVLRGEVRRRLLADGAAACEGHAAELSAVTGEATRLAELEALLAEVREGHPALLDEHRGVSTFRRRSSVSGGSAEDRAAVDGREHRASDITARTGTGVYAPLSGRVIFSGGHPGYGNLVRVLHPSPPHTEEAPDGPLESVYAHLCERLVAQGDDVGAGTALGMIGRTTGDEDPDGDGEGSSGFVRPTTRPRASHLHMAVIPRGSSALAPDAVHEDHSSDRENRASNHVHPDRWLAELGVTISAAPVLAMSEGEATAAHADAVARGGATETHRVTSEGRAVYPRERPAETAEPAAEAGAEAPVMRALDPHHAAAVPVVVQRDPEEVHGTDAVVGLPGGATAEQVRTAIAYNDGRELRIDWVRRLQSHVRADGAMTSVDGSFDTDTVVGVMRVQHAAGRTADGRITPATRTMLERLYPELDATLLGEHLESGRLLVPGEATTRQRYDYYRSIIAEAGGVFLDGPREINLVAIRGVTVTEVGAALELRQSGSAAELAAARAEDEAALADGSAAGDSLHDRSAHPPEHFSGRAGFDDVIVSVWCELPAGADAECAEPGSAERVYHVSERRGSVDPASAWSDSDDNPNPESEGTAHLRDGQYLFELGVHGTGAPAHRRAVREAYGGEHAGGPVRVSEAGGSTRYTALVPARGRDVEIWRDGAGDLDDDHYPTAEEEATSEEAVRDHRGRYVSSEAIGIHIHSSPDAGPSSVGCQTVPPSEGYDDFIGEIAASANSHDVYYTLIDASRIDRGLRIDRQELMSR